MVETTDKRRPLPPPGLLGREIGVALLLKIILLTGLWLLIFRWPDRPSAKPDVAQHLALPDSSAHIDFTLQSLKESSHDR